MYFEVEYLESNEYWFIWKQSSSKTRQRYFIQRSEPLMYFKKALSKLYYFFAAIYNMVNSEMILLMTISYRNLKFRYTQILPSLRFTSHFKYRREGVQNTSMD